MLIKILEPDIQKAEAIEMDIVKAVIELGIVVDIEKVSKSDKIQKYNISQPPGIVVNEKVKASGVIPTKEELKKWIEEELKPAGALS